ncbi:hypothetical protein PINS_up016265 [Pythium insidiosum]|nr:hypothetical protein PINS_up016265 [Pythium insidiosum]
MALCMQRALWSSELSVHACFAAWKDWRRRKQQKQTQQHFARQHMRKQSQQLLLQQWKLMTLQSRSEKELQALREQQTEAMDRTTRELTATVEQLQRELDATRHELAAAQRGRREVENDLRQVFLRGVSAMNIEALTLLKATHPQRLEERDEQSLDDNSVPHQSAASAEDSETTDEGELPSHERMIPVRSPADSSELHNKLQAMLPTQQAADASQTKGNAEPVTDPNRGARLVRSTSAMAALFGHQREAPTASPPTTAQPPPPPPPTAAVHGLRSAELVEAHQRMAHVTALPTSAGLKQQAPLVVPSPALQRAKTQASTKFQVEMEYIKSSVEAAAYSGRLASKSTRSGSPVALSRANSFSFASHAMKSAFSASQASVTSASSSSSTRSAPPRTSGGLKWRRT